MATAGKSWFGSRLSLSILGAVTWVFTTAIAVLAVLNAASLVSQRMSFRGLGIAAAALDVTAFVIVGMFLVLLLWKKDADRFRDARRKHVLLVACILPSVASIILTLISLVLTAVNQSRVTEANTGFWNRQLPAKWAIWGLSSFFQALLWGCAVLLLHRRPSPNPPQLDSSGIRDSVLSEVRETTPPMSLQPYKPLHTSPVFSNASSQSVISWRSSLQQIVRPVTSRTRLIGRPDSMTRDSRSVYSEPRSISVVSQDAFDTWDTSSVDAQARDAVMQSAPSRGTALETIPGSRPASPARRLDGPFTAPSSRRGSALSLPPKIPGDSSRPSSSATSEAHIHPLFRTDSPTPPPAATPGTVVIASPLSGQVISRPTSRMRSDSRATLRSPLMHSQSFTDLRTRTPSPPGRKMTPPIPDFILSGSPRNSLAGSGTRKISLQRNDEK